VDLNEQTPDSVGSSGHSRKERARIAAGRVLLVVGAAMLVWAFVVWKWNDPLTGLYTRWEQHQLVAIHDRIAVEFKAPRLLPQQTSPGVAAKEVARAAQRLRSEAPVDTPIGKIIVPRLGLDMLMLNSTSSEALKRGPGLDPRTFLPGQGKLVYIAGHRTTYLAPFAKIDTLRSGDRVTLVMPYARFDYVVTGHQIVNADDLSVLRSHGKEVVALQACHPRFFATHRYIVWAKPVEVTLAGGAHYRPSSS
jgi:sortase A